MKRAVYDSPGHEFSGIIEALGDEARQYGFKEGDHVSGSAWDFCGKCFNCRNGDENHCTNIRGVDCFSEYIVANHKQIVVIPPEFPLSTATLTDPLSYCLYNLTKGIEIRRFNKVLIFGINTMSMIMLLLVKHFGADTIVVVERNASKLQFARELGAAEVLLTSQPDFETRAMCAADNHGYDLILEMSREPEMLSFAAHLVGIRGKIMFSCGYSFYTRIDLSLNNLYLKEAELVAFHIAGYTLSKAVTLLQKLDLSSLINKIYDFEDINKAFQKHLTNRYLRILIKISE